MRTKASARGVVLVGLLASWLLTPWGMVCAQVAGAGCWEKGQTVALWPQITFAPTADIAEYRRVMRQGRDQVRREMERELIWMLRELARAGAELDGVVEPVLSALLVFDEVHQRHQAAARQGVPRYFEVHLRSALEDLYRRQRIAPEERRLLWVNVGLAERVTQLRERMRREEPVEQQDLAQLLRVAQTVDAVAYGTFSSDGDRHQLSLTVERVRSGAVCDFAVHGPLDQLPALLAGMVFDQFQAVAYPPANDPNPHLTWIPPSPGHDRVSAEEAYWYCTSQGQGVRLPYAVELVKAAQVGSTGVAYVAGGIPRLQPGPWVVADRLYADDQYYYYQTTAGTVDNHPAGPVRTAAGLGQVRARYWCVRGEPDSRALDIDRLYGLYRTISGAQPESPALAAIEYLLKERRALGGMAWRTASFAGPEQAWAVLRTFCPRLASDPTGARGGRFALAQPVQRCDRVAPRVRGAGGGAKRHPPGG